MSYVTSFFILFFFDINISPLFIYTEGNRIPAVRIPVTEFAILDPWGAILYFGEVLLLLIDSNTFFIRVIISELIQREWDTHC